MENINSQSQDAGMSGRVCYLASPIDQARAHKTLWWERARAIAILNRLGFSVFDPAGGWTSVQPYPVEIRLVDEQALQLADAVMALWPDGVPSTGVPMEIERALSLGKPVALVGNHTSPFLRQRDNLGVFRHGQENAAAQWLDQLVKGHGAMFALASAVEAEAVSVDVHTSEFEAAMEKTRLILADAIPITIKGLLARVKDFQEAKGWLGDGRTFGDDIALMHSELSEALEEHRKGRAPNESYLGRTDPFRSGDPDKPEGIPSEFADLLIRLAGACNEWNIDLEEALRLKLDYNDTREHRHGGLRL